MINSNNVAQKYEKAYVPYFFCSYTFSCDIGGFAGLVVRMLASGSRVRGFKPGRSLWIFLYIKILSMSSFGREVK
jgi:hypothetical protein